MEPIIQPDNYYQLTIDEIALESTKHDVLPRLRDFVSSNNAIEPEQAQEYSFEMIPLSPRELAYMDKCHNAAANIIASYGYRGEIKPDSDTVYKYKVTSSSPDDDIALTSFFDPATGLTFMYEGDDFEHAYPHELVHKYQLRRDFLIDKDHVEFSVGMAMPTKFKELDWISEAVAVEVGLEIQEKATNSYRRKGPLFIEAVDDYIEERKHFYFLIEQLTHFIEHGLCPHTLIESLNERLKSTKFWITGNEIAMERLLKAATFNSDAFISVLILMGEAYDSKSVVDADGQFTLKGIELILDRSIGFQYGFRSNIYKELKL